MNAEALHKIAEMAVNGMEPSERDAFLTMFENGHSDIAALFGRQAALRTINRNITMANMALSDPAILSGLTEAVSLKL